jgi:succinate dehydrogenase hydrophobic anchor subunit
MCLAVDDIEIEWADPESMTDEELNQQALALASQFSECTTMPSHFTLRYHLWVGLKQVKAEFNRRRAVRKKT